MRTASEVADAPSLSVALAVNAMLVPNGGLVQVSSQKFVGTMATGEIGDGTAFT